MNPEVLQEFVDAGRWSPDKYTRGYDRHEWAARGFSVRRMPRRPQAHETREQALEARRASWREYARRQAKARRCRGCPEEFRRARPGIFCVRCGRSFWRHFRRLVAA